MNCVGIGRDQKQGDHIRYRTIQQVRNIEVGGSLHWKWRDTFERDWEDRIDRPFQVGERAEMTGIMEASLTDKELKGRI